MPGGPSPDREQRIQDHRRREADDLRLILRLRPNQETAWAAFQAADGPPPPAVATPERLAAAEQRMAERDAAFHRHAKATLDLYAALAPDQRQAFDAAMRLRGPPRGGPEGPGPGGGPPPP